MDPVPRAPWRFSQRLIFLSDRLGRTCIPSTAAKAHNSSICRMSPGSRGWLIAVRQNKLPGRRASDRPGRATARKQQGEGAERRRSATG